MINRNAIQNDIAIVLPNTLFFAFVIWNDLVEYI